MLQPALSILQLQMQFIRHAMKTACHVLALSVLTASPVNLPSSLPAKQDRLPNACLPVAFRVPQLPVKIVILSAMDARDLEMRGACLAWKTAPLQMTSQCASHSVREVPTWVVFLMPVLSTSAGVVTLSVGTVLDPPTRTVCSAERLVFSQARADLRVYLRVKLGSTCSW